MNTLTTFKHLQISESDTVYVVAERNKLIKGTITDVRFRLSNETSMLSYGIQYNSKQGIKIDFFLDHCVFTDIESALEAM